MDINEIGKFGLIDRLSAQFRPSLPSTVKGIGDDAAILRYGDANIAVTTATLIEGINFDLTYFPLQHLGYKAAIAGFSNLYAMNATPRQIFVSIAVSAKFSVEALDRLYQGIKLACERHEVDLAGGDTVPSLTGLAITVASIGEAETAKVTYRNTAQKGDLICVSGNLGAAYMGLQILEREKKLFNEDPSIKPKLDDYAYVVGRYLKPEARREIIKFLASNGMTPTSMIDISSGLSPDLLHICKTSGMGCEIHYHKIPIAEETEAAAQEFNLEAVIVALNGGNDYELLFTIPVADYEKLLRNEDISIIGYVKDRDEGCNLMSGNGSKIELR